MLRHRRQPSRRCDPTAGSPCPEPPPPGGGSLGVEGSLKRDGGKYRGRMMRRRNITIKPSSVTCNPHTDVIVSLSVVVLQVHTVDAGVGSLSG